jgi:hypothetical protein
MIGRWARRTTSALLLALPLNAQESTRPAAAPMRVPFGVGETME